jgi:hypothetical protein
MSQLFGSLGFLPRIHFFLWLMSNNMLLTSDNLEKRRVEDLTCLFCKKKETISHLFFECVIARQAWLMLAEVVGFNMGLDYETMARCWLCNAKYGLANVLSSAVCWGIWKLRNAFCFQGVHWRSLKQVWAMVLPMLRCWRVLMLLKMLSGFDSALDLMKKMCYKSLQLEKVRAWMVLPDAMNCVPGAGQSTSSESGT